MDQRRMSLNREDPPVLKPKATIFTSTINLIKNVVAAGTVSLPFTLYCSSIIPGLVLLCIVAFLSGYSFILMARCCLMSGVYSYKEVARVVYGERASWWVDISVLLYTLGSTVSYIVVIGDWIPKVMTGWGATDFFTNRTVVVIAFMIVFVIPLAFLNNLDPLKITSSVGIICMLYGCGVVIVRAATDDSAGTDVKVFLLSLDLFRAIPVMTVSFAAHYSGPKFFLELGSDLRKWSWVIFYETISVGLFYALLAVAGYVHFGSDIKGDLFDNYDSGDLPILWARLFLAIAVTFTIPFSFLSVRRHTANVIYGLDDDFNYPPLRKFVITMTLLALCVLVGLVFPDVEIVISFKGSLLGTPVIYVLPALFYLKMLQKDRRLGNHSWSASNPTSDVYKPLNTDFGKDRYRYGLAASVEDSPPYLADGDLDSLEQESTCCGLLRGLHWRDWLGPVILIVFGISTGIVSFIMTVLKLL